jgi:lambda repressor-like predicted transcriptional regulator
MKLPQPSPGKWLHEAIMGALKGRGLSLATWCDDNEIGRQTIRSYTCGVNAGPRSEELLNKLIDDAGRETVLSMYQHRLLQQAEEFKRWAA